MVSHPSTNEAWRSLTSLIGREAVHSTQYGRIQNPYPLHHQVIPYGGSEKQFLYRFSFLVLIPFSLSVLVLSLFSSLLISRLELFVARQCSLPFSLSIFIFLFFPFFPSYLDTISFFSIYDVLFRIIGKYIFISRLEDRIFFIPRRIVCFLRGRIGSI